MKILPLLTGLLITTVGVIAIADGDLWQGWQWILAASAAVVGVSGLASALSSRSDEAQ